MKFYETHNRSITKAITFRLVIILSDTILVYAFTRRYDLTAGIVITSNILSTFIYFGHERAWNTIHWGKRAKKS